MGGSPILRYDYRYDTKADNTWTAWAQITTGSTTQKTLGSLTNGETYAYQVRAVNVNGASNGSNVVKVTIPIPPTAPGVPGKFPCDGAR